MGLSSGNGRIKAVEIGVAAKTAGRIEEILVGGGDLVEAGWVLARMDTGQLEIYHSQAGGAQREAQLDAARRRLTRTEALAKREVASLLLLDEHRAGRAGGKGRRCRSASTACRLIGGVWLRQAMVDDAQAAATAARAGEVLSGGACALNLVDLDEVYKTFILPSAQPAVSPNCPRALDEAFIAYLEDATADQQTPARSPAQCGAADGTEAARTASPIRRFLDLRLDAGLHAARAARAAPRSDPRHAGLSGLRHPDARHRLRYQIGRGGL